MCIRDRAEGDERARKIYETIGVHFGYAIAHYARFYDIRNLLFLGRVDVYKRQGIRRMIPAEYVYRHGEEHDGNQDGREQGNELVR